MLLFLVQRLYLSQIGDYIQRKDIRSIRKWCKSNNITIYDDESKEFVLTPEFDLAYDKPVIKYLHQKHGDNWKEYYGHYRNNEVWKLAEPITGTETRKNKSYKPLGDITSKLMNKK